MPNRFSKNIQIGIAQRSLSKFDYYIRSRKEFKLDLPDNFNILETEKNNYRKLLEIHLDLGEASMIAFALENSDTLLVLDDRKARKLAKIITDNNNGNFWSYN